MVKVAIGDIFKSDAHALVNTVNCVGIMGKGVAADFKERFPRMFEEYKQLCDAGRIKTGELTLYADLFSDKVVINFPTKKHWKSPTLLKDIEQGLDYFAANYKEWGIKSVAFPPLGCGNGGLSWTSVGPLMYEKLSALDIPVHIYAPFGTPAKQLTEEFLKTTSDSARKKGVRIRGRLTSGEISVLETLYRLQQERFAKPVGRTMYQKACYILSQTGADTGFIFTKRDYGPFSNEAAQSLVVFANNNLTQEEQVGNMFKLTVTDNYQQIRSQYAEELEQNKAFIDRAVDLLSRIKDTTQGEEVTTVIYAANMLGLERRTTDLEPDDVVDYVLNWKKSWNVSSKKKVIEETIEDLSTLNWVNLKTV